MRGMARSALPLLLVLASTPAVCAAQASAVNRCVGPDGVPVYTDRACDALGAVARPQAPDAASAAPREGAGGRFAQRGCARRPEQLARELHAALMSGDVNRIAGVYDWTGLGGAEARSVLQRLQALPQQDVGTVALETADAAFSATSAGDASGAPARAAAAPTAVRIERLHTSLQPTPPARMDLRQRAGCWWVRF